MLSYGGTMSVSRRLRTERHAVFSIGTLFNLLSDISSVEGKSNNTPAQALREKYRRFIISSLQSPLKIL